MLGGEPMTYSPIDLLTLADLLKYVSPDCRDVWVRSLMAIKDEFGASGEETAKVWSQKSDSYKEADFRDVWKSCKHGSINIGWLIKQAQDNGFKFAPISELQKATLAREVIQRKATLAKQRKLEASQIKTQHMAASKQAESILINTLYSSDNHPYLVAKGIKPFEALVGKYGGVDNALIIPITGIEEPFIGEVQSLQFILPDGTKRYLKGGKKSGGFYPVQWRYDAPIVICEGYATGATLAEQFAPSYSVICAFDSGNLMAVAKAFRKRYPEIEIIIAGDNDHETERVTGINTGRQKATEAANMIGGETSIPDFKQGEHGTDWNDRYLLDMAKEASND